MTFKRKLFLGVALLAGGCARVPQAPPSARRLPPPGPIVMAPPSSEVLAQRSAGPPAAAVLQATSDAPAWRVPLVTLATPPPATFPPGQAEARRARRVLRWQQRMTAAVALSTQTTPLPATDEPPMHREAVKAAWLGLGGWAAIPVGSLLLYAVLNGVASNGGWSLGNALLLILFAYVVLAGFISLALYLAISAIIVGSDAQHDIRASKGTLRGIGWANAGKWAGIGFLATLLVSAITSLARSR